ncbi:MAG: response regulator [Magnetococcales bacterium]|nr:response regulator [Magnetococcales bacterium]
MSDSAKPGEPLVRILLVDDEEITERLLHQIIKHETDFELHFCPDPNQAIQMAESIRPVLMLVDLLMPDIDGITLIRRLRNRRSFSQLPILMLSSEEDPYIKAQAFAAGANDYLVKLPNKVEMIARLRHHARSFLHSSRRNTNSELCSDIIHSDLKGFWLIDARTHQIIEVNDALCAMLGYSRESFIGKTPLDFVNNDNRAAMQKALCWIPRTDKRIHEIYLSTLTSQQLYTRFCVTTTHHTLGREIVSSFTFLNLDRLNLDYFEILKNEFRFIADSVPGLLWLSNPDNKRMFFNKTWLHFRGVILEQELEGGWQQGVHPDDLERYRFFSNEAFVHLHPYSLEFRLRNSHGEYRWFYETALPRFAGNGFFMGFSGSCVDITERKLLEGRMNQVNYSLEQQVQLRTSELQHEVQERRQAEFLERRANQAQGVVSDLLRIALEDAPLADQLQRALRAILAVPWLTMQKKGAIFLADRAAKQLQLVAEEALPAGVRNNCAWVPYGRCLCGRVAEAGQSIRCEKPLYSHAQEDEAHGHYCLPIQSGDRILGVLHLYLDAHRDNNAFEEEFLHTATNALAVLIEHAQIAQLKDAKLRADAENRAKSEFLATMSHEIRTPMNAIVGMAELLCAEEISPKARHYADSMMQAGEALLTLVNDILDYSKISAGKLTLEKKDFDLHQLLQGLNKLFEGLIKEKGLQFTIQIAPDVPRFVQGDSVRVWQILVNLLSNGIKFTHQGEVVLSAERVVLQQESPEGMYLLCFQVRDSGIGIAPEFFVRLFKLFEQGDKAIARRYGGTGLGLAITKMLVHLMAGEIEVESTVGVGSLFRVTLPLAYPQQEALPDLVIPTVAPVEGDMASCRILVVEDDPVNRVVELGMLRRLGVQADVAENGVEALEKLRAKEYDLVFMDCQMPQMDGYAASHAWRLHEARFSDRRRVPIIALTAFAMQGDRERCLQAGMDDYMTKPVRGKDFQAMLARWARPSRAAERAE